MKFNVIDPATGENVLGGSVSAEAHRAYCLTAVRDPFSKFEELEPGQALLVSASLCGERKTSKVVRGEDNMATALEQKFRRWFKWWNGKTFSYESEEVFIPEEIEKAYEAGYNAALKDHLTK